MGAHGGCLRDQVVVTLVISQPCGTKTQINDRNTSWIMSELAKIELRLTPKGVPAEHGARLQPSSNLLDPLVIEGHPCRLVGALTTGFCVLPEVVGGELFIRLNGIGAPTTLSRVAEETERTG